MLYKKKHRLNKEEAFNAQETKTFSPNDNQE